MEIAEKCAAILSPPQAGAPQARTDDPCLAATLQIGGFEQRQLREQHPVQAQQQRGGADDGREGSYQKQQQGVRCRQKEEGVPLQHHILAVKGSTVSLLEVMAREVLRYMCEERLIPTTWLNEVSLPKGGHGSGLKGSLQSQASAVYKSKILGEMSKSCLQNCRNNSNSAMFVYAILAGRSWSGHCQLLCFVQGTC